MPPPVEGGSGGGYVGAGEVGGLGVVGIAERDGIAWNADVAQNCGLE